MRSLRAAIDAMYCLPAAVRDGDWVAIQQRFNEAEEHAQDAARLALLVGLDPRWPWAAVAMAASHDDATCLDALLWAKQILDEIIGPSD